MTPEAYQLELVKRGFTFNAGCNQWHGPFGLTVTGYLNADDQIFGPGREVDNAFARVSALKQLDEQLRAKRGLPNPPLVQPAKEFSPDYQPYRQIMPPQA